MSSAALLVADIETHSQGLAASDLDVSVATLSSLVCDRRVAVDVATAHQVLNGLRRKRQFKALITLASAFEAAGMADPTIRRLHGQALIDSITGQDPEARYAEAVRHLEAALAATPRDSREQRELQGLIGRAWKQCYVDRRALRPTAADAEILQKAVAAYAQVVKQYEFARDNWHFVNFIALTARAERDGIHPGHDVDSRTLALALVDVLKEAQSAEKPDMWAIASLGEARIALGDMAGAERAYRHYAQLADTNVFEFFASLRQLSEVWQFTRDGAAAPIIALLEARLGDLLPRQAALNAADEQRLARMGSDLARPVTVAATASERPEHAPLGDVARDYPTPPPLSLLITRARRATAVPRIKDRRSDRYRGTGFLVRGEDLAPRFSGETCLVTNSHVIGLLEGALLRPRAAVIELSDIFGRVYSFSLNDDDLLWESRSDKLDTTIIRLRRRPDGFDPLDLVEPEAFPDDWEHLHDDDRACHIAGYFGDWRLSVSETTYPIVDLGWRTSDATHHVFLHHHAPTEPGSSGSPLFNLDWKVIALHRAGTCDGRQLRALGGRPDYRVAKMAVSINAIRRAIASDGQGPPAGRAAEPAQLPDKALIALLRDDQADEERIDQLTEWDVERSEPWAPVLKRRVASDGTRPEGPVEDTLWQIGAVGLSYGFRARRNLAFKRRPSGTPGLTLISDGDSWFQYPVPGIADVIDHIAARHNVLCHAVAGRMLVQQVAQSSEVTLPSIREHRPDAVLLSGGGNDILSFGAIQLFVGRARSGARGADLIKSDLLEAKLTELVGHYATWVERILEAHAGTRVFCHGYDWTLPISGDMGRWLSRPLREQCGVDDLAEQRDIARHVIDRFNARMMELESRFAGAVWFVDCRGAVGLDPQVWHDELHPRSEGFGRVAGRFERRLAEVFKDDPRLAATGRAGAV